jgi:RNA polymerase sigma factor (sigma-70 family)
MPATPMDNIIQYLRGTLLPESAELTDGQLLECFVSRREPAALEALVQRHGPMVWGVCRRVLRNHHDAEDAFQATYLVLVRKAASITPREMVGNWLYGVAYQTALKARATEAKRKGRERPVTPMPEPAVTYHDYWSDLQPLLDQAVNLLPAKYRAVIVLCDLEGKTKSEAARQLGLPEGTVASRVARARTILARRLARHGLALSSATLAGVLSKQAASAAVPTSVTTSTIKVVTLVAAGQAATTELLSAKVAALTEGVMKTMLLTKLRIGIAFLLVAALSAIGTGVIAHHLVAAVQQKAQTHVAQPENHRPTESSADPAKLADAEMHVIGVYGAKLSKGGSVDVVVRATAKPIVLVLTSYYGNNWHIKLADGARIKKVILSGYFEQAIDGLPAGVPIENRSYFPEDGSRRKRGWFWAHVWNSPQWREMVRRLNEMTGLPIATYQGKYQGDSFIVDGKLGHDLGQQELKPRTPAPKELTPQELLAASANAELHVVGISSPDMNNPGKPVNVEVRSTARPVVLVLTSSMEAVWNVKRAQGARIKAVIVVGGQPQEIDGIPADVPIRHFCPDASTFFEGVRSLREDQAFYAYQGNTLEYRRMVEWLNSLTGLLVSTFQGEEKGKSFVVDGARGRNFAQKERKPRRIVPKEFTPEELLAVAAHGELHVVGISGAAAGNGAPVNVEVRPTAKPIVLALTAYGSVLWNVKIANGAQVKAVIIAGYFEQEFEGIPANIPIVNRSYFPDDGSRRKHGWFYADHWNTPQWREMVRRLNEMTGLPVATFQGKGQGDSFIVDGDRGRNFGQNRLKFNGPVPKELTPQELLAASANAELHVVGIYSPDLNNPGKPVDVEVRSTAKPVVLVLTSYMEAVWNVKRAPGARLAAVLVGSPFPQAVDGLPAGVPVQPFYPNASSYYFDGRAARRDKQSFHAYQENTLEYRRMVERLNDLTGLLVSTFQGESTGRSFIVDGTRGRSFAQKERKPRPMLPKEPTRQELLAASAGAELQVVGIYGNDAGNGAPVDVEVRPTAKPMVLALSSYLSVLWNVKIAEGARVKAVLISGYSQQEFAGIPSHIPIVYRAYFPSGKQDYIYIGYEWNTREYRQMVERLNDLTDLLVATFQGANSGSSFVVDGIRGRDFAQKERKVKAASGRGFAQPKPEEDPLADVADIPSQELQAAGDTQKRYFLIGPKKNTQPPAEGYGLVIILPGGDGSADFHPFVKRIYKHVLSDRYLAAQPIAVQWTPEQEIVWPTKTNPVPEMRFGTEEFVEVVIEDVAKKHKLDRTRVFTLSWSSSGPAAYAASLQSKHSITGSFIAMSVFNPEFLPPVKAANGHAYYLYHSKQDRLCPYRMAERAKTSLAENGAKVRLQTYEGGHGWRGNVYKDIRAGVEWLEKNSKKASVP